MDLPEAVIVGATRYYLGRMTYAVQEYCDWLVKNWPEIDDRTREVVWLDVEEAFERDDKDRSEGRAHKSLGMDCDREQWERVRSLWRQR